MKGDRLKPEQLQNIAETLAKSHHQHLGVTRYPLQPPHAPAAVRLGHTDILSFTNALDAAREQWPGSDLCLIGAHGALGETNVDDPRDTLPPGLMQLLDPDLLIRIPVGDPEDQGD